MRLFAIGRLTLTIFELNLNNQNFMELDDKGIATGDTKDDKKQRKQFIVDFYGKWIIENPEKHLYNNSLDAFIEVRFLSLEETAGHASLNYKSTVAVTFLSEIMENAVARKDEHGKLIVERPKPNVKNQSRFSKIFVMDYDKTDFGIIKLTVGELRGSGQKQQYCITAMENG
jgi:hypothetical protein